jgi:hypothetical protein
MLIDSWSVWDGDYYKAIALNGYTFDNVAWPSVTFFPLYPLLIRAALPIAGGNVALAALAVSNLAAFLAVVLLYQLLESDFGSAIAYRSIFLLLLFPTSFFFAAGYTESLALLLAVAVVWALRGHRWWLAGIAGFFLALTRLPGVLVAPIIALTYLEYHGWRWRALRWDVLAVGLPPLGLALFMLYQWRRFGTPLAFLIAQEHYQQQMSPPWVIPQTLFIRLQTEGLAIFGLHLVLWAVFIVLAVLVWRRLPREYGLLMLLLVPAYLGSWAVSIGRHILIGFPAFVVLAMYSERRWARGLLIGIVVPLLALCVALFVNTFWVA